VRSDGHKEEGGEEKGKEEISWFSMLGEILLPQPDSSIHSIERFFAPAAGPFLALGATPGKERTTRGC
jgi:hypothetical protein